MNGFGEYPFLFYVDDDMMFDDLDFAIEVDDDGKIVELLDTGCDARIPLSILPQDLRQKYKVHHSNHPLNEQDLENTFDVRKGQKNHEKKKWTKKEKVDKLSEEDESGPQQNRSNVKRSKIAQNKFFYEDHQTKNQARSKKYDVQNSFQDQIHKNSSGLSDLSQSEHSNTSSKILQENEKRPKVKRNFLHQDRKYNSRKLINESGSRPSLQDDSRDSICFYRGFKEFKNCAVDKDSLSDLSKVTDSSTSNESSLNQKTVANRSSSSIKINQKIKSTRPSLKITKNEASDKSTHTTILKTVRNTKEQEPKNQKNVSQNNSFSKQSSSSKSSRTSNPRPELPKTTFNKTDKLHYKRRMSVEMSNRAETSSVSSNNSTVVINKKKRPSKLPIRIGGPIRTKKDNKIQETRAENNTKIDTSNAMLSENAVQNVQVTENNNENQNEVSPVNRGSTKKLNVNFNSLDQTAGRSMSNKSIPNEQRPPLERGSEFWKSKLEELHLKRRAVDLKVLNMAKATREQRKREFARYGFEEDRNRDKNEPREILDIGIRLVEKTTGRNEAQGYGNFIGGSQFTLHSVVASKTPGRRDSFHSKR